MAVNMNLRDLRNPQYTAVTGRKPTSDYGAALTAMGPYARASAEQDNLNKIREKEFLEGVRQADATLLQNKTQADATLLQNKTQYDTSLTQAKEQFNAGQAMTQEQMDAAKKQATTSNIIQGTAATAGLAYVAGKYGLIPGVGATTATGTTLGTGAALPGATLTEGAGTAATGAELMSGTGAPLQGATLTEGGSTVAGAGGSGTTAAGTMTVGNVVPVIGASYVGSQVGNAIAQPVGESIGAGGESERGFVGEVGGGAATGALVGGAMTGGVGAPIGAAIGATVGFATWVKDSWICTEIKQRLGISSANVEHLSLLRRYAIKNHRAESAKYFKNGKLLVAALNADPAASGNYEGLHDRLVQTCGHLVAAEQFEEAYLHYKAVVDELCEQYNVDLTIKENGRQ